MRRTNIAGLAVFSGLLTTTALVDAAPITIDFEAQGAGAPIGFSGPLDSPLVIGIATFTGGKLLNHETLGTDQTAVYGTSNQFDFGPGPFPAYSDPLTISFSVPVSEFSVILTNEEADIYTVRDNLGHGTSPGFDLTSIPFFLADTGITSVTITGAAQKWDFAIDNVQFTPPSPAVPEPATMALTGIGLVGLARWRRRWVSANRPNS